MKRLILTHLQAIPSETYKVLSKIGYFHQKLGIFTKNWVFSPKIGYFHQKLGIFTKNWVFSPKDTYHSPFCHNCKSNVLQ
jgi:hypothetical protein